MKQLSASPFHVPSYENSFDRKVSRGAGDVAVLAGSMALGVGPAMGPQVFSLPAPTLMTTLGFAVPQAGAISVSTSQAAGALGVGSMLFAKPVRPEDGGDDRFTQHAEERAARGRPTGTALNDGMQAGPSDVFVQQDGRVIVRGGKGREHVFEPDGRLLTSIPDRSNAAHLGLVRAGERTKATANQFTAFKSTLKTLLQQ